MKIEVDRGRLRLRFPSGIFEGKRPVLYLNLNDTKTNRLKAQAVILQIEADLEAGTFDHSLEKYRSQASFVKHLPAVQIVERWLAFKSTHLDQRTIKKHRQTVLRRVSGFFEDRPATKTESIEFLAWMQEFRVKGETTRRYLELIEAVWDWAIEQGIARENPFKGLKNLVRKEERREANPFTRAEVEAILKAFEQHDYYSRYLPFVRFCFGTGCRIGEAIGLRWSDISEGCKTATISTQLTGGQRKKTKTGKTRKLLLPESLQQMLVEIPHTHTLVFTTNGRPIESHNFRSRAWVSCLKEAGVKYREPYNMRHTFISHALEAGMNPVKVSRITGHDVQVLFRHYAGLIDRPEIPDLDF